MGYPWWFIALIVVGLVLGGYLLVKAFFAEDDSEAVGYIFIGSLIFGFALMGLLGVLGLLC